MANDNRFICVKTNGWRKVVNLARTDGPNMGDVCQVTEISVNDGLKYFRLSGWAGLFRSDYFIPLVSRELENFERKNKRRVKKMTIEQWT